MLRRLYSDIPLDVPSSPTSTNTTSNYNNSPTRAMPQQSIHLNCKWKWLLNFLIFFATQLFWSFIRIIILNYNRIIFHIPASSAYQHMMNTHKSNDYQDSDSSDDVEQQLAMPTSPKQTIRYKTIIRNCNHFSSQHYHIFHPLHMSPSVLSMTR